MKDTFRLDETRRRGLAEEDAEGASAADPWPESGEGERESFSGESADSIDEPEAPADIYVLSPIEVRVLACLIEKEKTVPQSYPLTLQHLTLACNQTSSRDPVMRLEEGEVSSAARSLQQKGLVQSPPSARAERYSHQAHRVYGLLPAALAAICILMLRGPQTASEIFQRSKRIHPFADKEEVESALDALMRRQPALACHYRSPGRGLRYIHCLPPTSSLPDDLVPPAISKTAPEAPPAERSSIQSSSSASPQPTEALETWPTPMPPPSATLRLNEALEGLSRQVARLIDRLDRLERHLEGMDTGNALFNEDSSGGYPSDSS